MFYEEGTIEDASKYFSQILNRSETNFSVIEIWNEETLGPPAAISYIDMHNAYSLLEEKFSIKENMLSYGFLSRIKYLNNATMKR